MLKNFIGCIREYKRASILSAVFVSLEVVCEVLIPLVMARLIDAGVDAGNMSMIVKYGALLLTIALISLLFGACSAKFCADASAGYAKNLRHDIYHKVQKFDFANIDKFSTAGIVTRLTTDVTNVQMAYMMIIRIAVRSPLMLVFALVMSFSISARLAWIFLLAIPFLGIGLYVMIRIAYPVFNRVFDKYDVLNRVVEENLSGIRVVKSFVREKFEIGKFNKSSEDIYHDFTKAESTVAFSMPMMQLAVYGCMLLLSWFGARLIVVGGMTTGELMSFFSYVMQLLMSLMMLSMIFVFITIARASVKRIGEIFDCEPQITDPSSPLTEVADGSISFTDVDFSYAGEGGTLSLSGVNLDIASGETVGILGGTGSAKTTLVQLIPRLYDVTDGTLTVGGHNVKEYSLQTLRDSVAMVLQKNVLFSGTIKDNLRWGNPDASDEELIAAAQVAQADDFISSFPHGYDTHIEQGGANVSGGQKQRLTIARALLKRPKILILDDSTSAVDTATDQKLRDALLSRLPQTTKIIIAQRVNSVMTADKIVIMDGGKIQDIGRHEELLARNPIYREVYESQMKGGEEDA